MCKHVTIIAIVTTLPCGREVTWVEGKKRVVTPGQACGVCPLVAWPGCGAGADFGAQSPRRLLDQGKRRRILVK